MYKFLAALLFASPVVLAAQQVPDSSSPAATLPSAPIAGNHSAVKRALHPLPVGSLTATYDYVYTDSQEGSNRTLMGWSVVPELNLYKGIGIQAEFESLYMRSVYPSQSRLLIAAGPRYTLAPRAKFTPFVYAEGGEMRLTGQGVQGSDWNPAAKGGIGLSYKLTRDFAFELIPGEYLGQYQDNGEWNHSYSARAGFTLNFNHGL